MRAAPSKNMTHWFAGQILLWIIPRFYVRTCVSKQGSYVTSAFVDSEIDMRLTCKSVTRWIGTEIFTYAFSELTPRDAYVSQHLRSYGCMSRLLAGHLLQRLQLIPMRCIPASSLELRLHVQAATYVRTHVCAAGCHSPASPSASDSELEPEELEL